MDLLLELLLDLLLHVFYHVPIRGRFAPPYNYVMIHISIVWLCLAGLGAKPFIGGHRLVIE